METIWFERDLGEVLIDGDVACHTVYVEEGTTVRVSGRVSYYEDIYGDGLLIAESGRICLSDGK